MRGLVLGVVLSLLSAPFVFAGGDALADFQDSYRGYDFTGSRLSPNGNLVLRATDRFAAAGYSAQAIAVRKVFEAWTRSLRANGAEKDPELLSVVWTSGGALWRRVDGGVRRIDEWSDQRLPGALAVENAPRNGRLFGFLGGQMVSGGAAPSQGLNVRLGSTLFQDRYDFALSYGYSSTGTSPAFHSSSYGLVTRALFPLTQHVGWNLGVQATHTVPSSGKALSVVGGVTGLNFYLPGGSFDVTLTAGNHSTYGLLAGFTLFFERQ